MHKNSRLKSFGRPFGALQRLLVFMGACLVASCADSETVQATDSVAAADAALADAPAPASAVLPGSSARTEPAGGVVATPATEAKGASVSRDQFKSLRWIAGNWAGNTKSKTPYFQSFEVINDTLITMHSYADAGFTAVSETGVIVATGGQVYYGPPSSAWIATKWEGNSIEFTPLKGATNSILWERVSKDEVRVTLIARPGGVEQRSAHVMTRRSR